MTSHLTKLPGVPDSDEIVPGMAYFHGTGPEGKTCGTCEHRGYRRERQVETWSKRLQRYVYRTYRWAGCHMFKRLAGRHGPRISPECPACKYYSPKGEPVV